jgi:hypothetical protein
MNGKQGFGGATPMKLFPLKDTTLFAAWFFILRLHYDVSGSKCGPFLSLGIGET